MTRPTKRTPENREALLTLLKTGLSLSKCYQAIGISKKCVQDWRADDPTLDEDISTARAESVRDLHQIVRDAAVDDAKHAQWLLTRIAPEDYSETQRTEHTFILEMPGLLKATTTKAQAWLTDAEDEDWKALDERAAAGELTDDDLALLETPQIEDEDSD